VVEGLLDPAPPDESQAQLVEDRPLGDEQRDGGTFDVQVDLDLPSGMSADRRSSTTAAPLARISKLRWAVQSPNRLSTVWVT
jgi:hypothetical protein